MPSEQAEDIIRTSLKESISSRLEQMIHFRTRLAHFATKTSDRSDLPEKLAQDLKNLAQDIIYAEPFYDHYWKDVEDARISITTAINNETQKIYFYDEGHARGGYWEQHTTNLGQELIKINEAIDAAIYSRMQIEMLFRTQEYFSY